MRFDSNYLAAIIVLFISLRNLVRSSRRRSLVVQENEKNGSSSWWLPQLPTDPIIEGFSTHTSYYPSSRVYFKLKCDSNYQSYRLEIYRLGYYGGKGARLLASTPLSTRNCEEQPKCLFVSPYRLTDCRNWRISADWKIPDDVVSGLYIALPIIRSVNNTALHYGNYIPFIIKQPPQAIPSEILFKTADLTWVAYNKYGGWNLYGHNGSKDFDTRAFAVSYNRPYTNRFQYPYGQSQNFLFNTEYPMLYWLEMLGYDISYASCSDVETRFSRDKQSFLQHKVLLSVGHDEYWTPGLREAYEGAREGGVSLGFFSGNEIYWRGYWGEDYNTHTTHPIKSNHSVQYNTFELPNTRLPFKDHRRVFVCRKESIPNHPPLEGAWTGTWSDPRRLPPNPEQSLTGQLFLVNSYRTDALLVPARDQLLRLWRNVTEMTGERDWLSPKGILGYEWDIFTTGLYRPTGLFSLSKTVMDVVGNLAEDWGARYRGSGRVEHRLVMYRYFPSPASTMNESSICSNLLHQSSLDTSKGHSSSSHSTSTLSTPPLSSRPLSSLVFSTGTIQWSWSLSSFRDGDPFPPSVSLQQATLNVLGDMGALPAPHLNEAGYVKLTAGRGVFPSPSTDYSPPISSILSSNLVIRSEESVPTLCLLLQGQAKDEGGGRVAVVEVSADGGRTWEEAEGRERWNYTLFFSPLPSSLPPSLRYGFHYPTYNLSHLPDRGEEGELRKRLFSSPLLYFPASSSPPKGQWLLLLVRAGDDSGNLESVVVTRELCDALSFLQKEESAGTAKGKGRDGGGKVGKEKKKKRDGKKRTEKATEGEVTNKVYIISKNSRIIFVKD